MMINKRLIGAVPESRKYIAYNVALQWLSLGANICMIWSLCTLLAKLPDHAFTAHDMGVTALVCAATLVVRVVCSMLSTKMGYLASKTVKKTLREKIYRKLLKLGASYQEKVQTSEIVQVFVEGVDQLETYFGAYLPQFFYAMLAPLTLFVVISTINVPAAVVLLICVPMIPIAIALVQTWAKKLLGKYWGQYTALGDTFLENLQGLTTLKIYQADAYKNVQMNEEAEKFRKITMRVLTMQLNSITIMDLVAYGGAALGVILAVTQMHRGAIGLSGCLLIILLSADFFLPMRLLGSFFHIAMNGMAASDKIFNLLDMEEPDHGSEKLSGRWDVKAEHLNFSYTEERPILKDLNLELPQGSFTAIVGKSGSGKSTFASLCMGRNRGYTGGLTLGGVELNRLSEAELMDSITYIGHKSYLFKGTVRENLAMAGDFTDEEMWAALEQVRLAAFLREEDGLDTQLLESASNLSGGQAQRLALARALLHNSPVYIFDEATSNIDVESENDIMAEIHRLSKTRTVILITHRLLNAVKADCIYVLKDGELAQSGPHEVLSRVDGPYQELWQTQQELELYQKEAVR